MPPFVTLRKGGVPYDFLLYEYDEAKGGGRLNKSSTLEELELATLKLKYEGRARFVPVSFDTDGYSRERIMDGTTYDVSGRAAQPPAAQPEGVLLTQVKQALSQLQMNIVSELAPIKNFISLSSPQLWGAFKPPSNPSSVTDAPSQDKQKQQRQDNFFQSIKQAYMRGSQLQCMLLGVDLPRSALTAGHLFPKWLARKGYEPVFGFEVDSNRNGVIWCTAIERAWDEQLVSFFLQPEGDKPGEQVYIMRVMHKDLMQVKLVDLAQKAVGKQRLSQQYMEALSSQTFQDLDGKVHLKFPPSDTRPYQGAFVWQALAAEHFASQAGKLPDGLEVRAMLVPQSPVAERIQIYFNSMDGAGSLNMNQHLASFPPIDE